MLARKYLTLIKVRKCYRMIMQQSYNCPTSVHILCDVSKNIISGTPNCIFCWIKCYTKSLCISICNMDQENIQIAHALSSEDGRVASIEMRATLKIADETYSRSSNGSPTVAERKYKSTITDEATSKSLQGSPTVAEKKYESKINIHEISNPIFSVNTRPELTLIFMQ